jgi:DNA-binding IclR family transcriptional regulator
MIGVGPGELARAYGWPTAAARAQLDGLVADGLAVHTDGVYRLTT